MELDSNIINEIISLAKDDPIFEEKCDVLANCIKDNKCAITQLVQDLGPLLTNTAVTEREKGTLALSIVLSRIPADILTDSQLNLICNFYSQRLNDHHQVVPAVIRGLIPLVSSKNIPQGLSTHLLNALFEHVPCQQQQQPDRYNIYSFIKTLLDKRKTEMKAMGLNLVYGVISAIDSERDPRNLLFLFKWLPTFLTTIELGQLTEEMFDVISCYFPVDFRPSTQDEHTITRETLANALCPCLCCIPSFADLCLPLALEKLESELRIAKLDSLDLLIESCKTFPNDSYKQHFSTIWALIQKEVFTNKDKQDKELEEKCLEALTLLLRKISPDTEFARQIIKDIIDTLKGNLRADALLFVPSWKLLRSVCQASKLSAESVFNHTSSLLINLYNITTTPTHKAVILQQLVEIAVKYVSTNPDVTFEDVEDLKSVPNICLKAILDANPQIRGIGISSFSNLAPYVSSTMRGYFYQNLSSLIVLEQESIVRTAILSSLKVYAGLYFEEIRKLLQDVPTNGLDSLNLYLEAVGSVVSVVELMPFSLEILTEHLLKTLDVSTIAARILREKFEENEAAISKYLNEDGGIITKITQYIVEELNHLNVESYRDYVDNIARILIIVIRHLNEYDQEILVPKQIDKIRSNKIDDDLKMVVLFGLLASLKPTARISIDFRDIYELTVQTDSPYICNIGSQLLATIINKISNDSTLNEYLTYIEDRSNNLLLANKHVDNVIEVVSLIAKALVIKSSPLMFLWVEKLINLSTDHLKAAKAFRIMFDDNSDCLNTKNYCVKRLLYKQKFFTEITNYFVSNYDDDHKHYLTILGYLLQNVPQQILRLELKKIIRLVLLCLSYCEECEVLLSVLSAANVIIGNKEQLAEDYLQEFLKYYLKLATFEKSMKVRILALKGIQLYAEYPLYKLLPLKQDVLAVLGICIDDKKRLVRGEAVETRSKWFLIDAPI